MLRSFINCMGTFTIRTFMILVRTGIIGTFNLRNFADQWGYVYFYLPLMRSTISHNMDIFLQIILERVDKIILWIIL